jgi:hypothetical protein
MTITGKIIYLQTNQISIIHVKFEMSFQLKFCNECDGKYLIGDDA